MNETKASAALLIIDVINPLDFEGATPLCHAAERVVEPIRKLRDAADGAGLPVVYINDHHGAWHAESTELIDKIAEADLPGSAIARRLKPRSHDYFVIKPQLSGFYATTLAALLPRLGVNRVAITGIAADICILFTAADAHMREYDLWVPCDTVAGEDDQHTTWALEIMRKSLGAETRGTDELSLADWIAAAH
jgi:nicotinamidase-related amidase